MDGIGAHVYALRTQCTGDDNAITGDLVKHAGHPDTIRSLHSEHYGALAILMLLLVVDWKYSIESTGFLLIDIDNMEVVN